MPGYGRRFLRHRLDSRHGLRNNDDRLYRFGDSRDGWDGNILHRLVRLFGFLADLAGGALRIDTFRGPGEADVGSKHERALPDRRIPPPLDLSHRVGIGLIWAFLALYIGGSAIDAALRFSQMIFRVCRLIPCMIKAVRKIGSGKTHRDLLTQNSRAMGTPHFNRK